MIKIKHPSLDIYEKISPIKINKTRATNIHFLAKFKLESFPIIRAEMNIILVL